jgi:hypothetical protein
VKEKKKDSFWAKRNVRRFTTAICYYAHTGPIGYQNRGWEKKKFFSCVMMEREKKGGPVGASAAQAKRAMDAQSLLSSVNGEEICLFYGRLLFFFVLSL